MEHNPSYSTQDERPIRKFRRHYSQKKEILEEQQQRKKKPGMQLYRNFTKEQKVSFDCYPAPLGLRPHMIEQIQKVLNHNLEGSFALKPDCKQQYEAEQFIYPKSIDIRELPKQSRIKKQFIHTYQEQFLNQGIQEIYNHPHAVSQILFSGLSASAQAACKWQSINTKRRMAAERPYCPDLSYYPLDDGAIKEIEQIKKQQNARIGKQDRHKRSMTEHRKTMDRLIKDVGSDTSQYLKQISKAQMAFSNIYGTEQGNYGLILEYADATKDNANRFDTNHADEFIQESEQTYQTDKQGWLSNKQNKQVRSVSVKLNPRRHKHGYYDPHDVYQVAPNEVQNTGVLFKNK